MTRYLIPLNEPINEQGEEQSQTVDVLHLEGTKKSKQKQWRRYLTIRCGIWDYHQANAIAKKLGFTELIK